MNSEKAFFDAVREKLFSGSLKESQVSGLKALLEATEIFSLCQRAYILATAYHETARTMQPIAEYGKGSGRAYGTWHVNSAGTRYCYKDSSKTSVYSADEYPHLFYGRGYVQLTWLSNYLKVSKELGFSDNCDAPDPTLFAREPNRVMQPDIAAQIMCFGMERGWFTGKKLSDYINNKQTDYYNARRIINGLDCAGNVATYAAKFESALRAMGE